MHSSLIPSTISLVLSIFQKFGVSPAAREITSSTRRVAQASKKVYAVHREHKAMGQLLVTLIVPPVVGLITYVVVRRIWERDENAPSEAGRRREPATKDERKEMPAH
jgi:hypothetical protein